MIKDSTDKTSQNNKGIVIASTDKSKNIVSPVSSSTVNGYDIVGETFEEKKDSIVEQINETYAEKRKRELQESADKFKKIREDRTINIGRKLDEDEQQAIDLIKTIKAKNYRNLTSEDLSAGSMLLMQNYDAKDKALAYDRTPLVIIIGSRHNSNYVLGLNVHWLPKVIRNTLWSGILKLFRNDIRMGKKPDITYQKIKSFLFNIGAQFAIRLYIKNRIAKKGIIINPEYMKQALMLPTESITGGMSAERVYKQAIIAAKTAKQVKKSRLK